MMQINKTVKKLKKRNGMSLSETLAAVLIMSFVTLVVAAGVTAGVRVYHTITERAEGETLLATNIAALSDYLESGYDIEQGTDNLDSIDIQLSEVSNTKVSIYNNGNDGIYLTYYKNDGTSVETPLISDAANTSGLYAVLSDISTNSSGLISYTITIYSKDGAPTKDTEEVEVRNTVHYPEETTETNS